MIKDTQTAYGVMSKSLHWIMAALLIGLFGVGLYMTDLGYYDSLYHILPWWHKSIGLVVVILLVLRVVWRLSNTRPAPLASHKAWEIKIASKMHVLLYLLILLIASSGYLISTSEGKGIEFFGWFEVPALLTLSTDTADLAGAAHFYLAWGLIVLAAAHAGAAIKHHVIDKDSTLIKMKPW